MTRALCEIGADGMRQRVQTHDGFARHLAALIEDSPVLELLAPVILSNCCFRFVPLDVTDDSQGQLNNLNRTLLRRLHSEARHVPSSTKINGRFAIRACYINPRNSLSDVEALDRDITRIGREIPR